jgi:hypothetical protein
MREGRGDACLRPGLDRGMTRCPEESRVFRCTKKNIRAILLEARRYLS